MQSTVLGQQKPAPETHARAAAELKCRFRLEPLPALPAHRTV